MPEPPKITTSLAERIAQLNSTKRSTQSQSSNGKHSNHLTSAASSDLPSATSATSQIKSKISRYEASGANEAPLIPKGSFGLGAPVAKSARGLDRIRIASLGVSGGEKPQFLLSAVVGSNAPGPHPTTTGRSVSLGSKRHHLVQQDDGPIDNHALVNPDGLSLGDTCPPSPIRKSKDSTDSSEAYDGILDGYPITPAEEEEHSVPMVSCADCSDLVELEMLAGHVCRGLTIQDGQQLDDPSRANSEPDEAHKPMPMDVPVDAEDDDLDHQPWLSTSEHSVPISACPSDLPSPTHSSSSVPVEAEVCSYPQPPPSIDQHQNNPPESSLLSQTEHRLGELQPPQHRLSSSSSSSTSTGTTTSNTSNSTKSSYPTNHEESASISNPKKAHKPNRSSNLSTVNKGRNSWYDDDDDDGIVEGTGYATIVRSSQRF